MDLTGLTHSIKNRPQISFRFVWVVLLVVTAIGTIFVAAHAAILFNRVIVAGEPVDVANISVPTVSTNRLKEAVRSIDLRAARFEAVRLGEQLPADPSR